jgi:arylsulfatase A-like enzyme
MALEMAVKLLNLLAAAAVVVLALAAWAAWRLFPVQILVLADRLRTPVGTTRPVRWAQGPATAPKGGRPPNVVLIVVDDLGFNDVTLEGHGSGVAGGLVPTPNIDAIAHQGADFVQAYAANATCSPARAALMTGRYPTRFGFEFTAVPSQLAKYVPRYTDRSRPHPTIYHAERQAQVPPMAEMGMPASEVTIAQVLKARGYHTVHLGKWHLGEWPPMRPEARGFDESLGFLAGAAKYLRNGGVSAKLPDPLDRLLWMAATDAVQFNGGPRFHAGEYMTDYLSRQAAAAIQANRNRPFFIYLAYNAPHTPFQATTSDYDALAAIKDHKTRVYGAMIRALDRGVGQVTAALKAEGLDRNTIVIFTNDNGGAWYAGLPEINKPFRGWKGTFFEGGIRVPFFVCWPDRIAAGQRPAMPVHHIDVLATLAAATGAAMPKGRPIDGINFLPFVDGNAARPAAARTLFWRSGGYEAVRDGNWKLQVSQNPPRIWLFDLAADPTERNDLSAERPEEVKRLRALLAAHDRELPKPLWPALLEEPIRIDQPADAPWRPGQEYVYWSN